MPFPASNNMAGTTTSFPDVCNTPSPSGPIPQPYPNMGMLMQANPGTVATMVLIAAAPALTIQSELMMTTGDQAGSMGGLVSGMIMGPARFLQSSVLVTVQGAPIIYQTCMMGANGMNANIPGLQDTPSQAIVIIGA